MDGFKLLEDDARRNDRARWFEVAISVAASVIFSAVTMSWSLSSTLARINEKQTEQDRRLGALESRENGPRISVLEARSDGVDARLTRIESKIDALLEQRSKH